LQGTRSSRATVLFMGWFGPRGLASIVLALVYLVREAGLAGNSTIRLAVMATVLLILAVLFDRLGRYEPAATVAGFALSPFAAAAFPEITTTIAHLRDVLGEATYESLAGKGEAMTTAAMAAYAYDQIDQARTELNAVSK